MAEELNERERDVLEAVVRSFVDSAEPAGSRTVARRFKLGISPATVRNTMADLEEKGFLYHPHTSAGRIPTDRAYRFYVDALMKPIRLSEAEKRRLVEELGELAPPTALERLLRRSAQALGLLSGELGLAVNPRLDDAVLEKLELLSVTAEKILLVLTLGSGSIRTIYIDLPGTMPSDTLLAVGMILNERLAGQTLGEIRKTLADRLRDIGEDPAVSDLLNIFVQSGDDLFRVGDAADDQIHLGRTSVLAAQPEFAGGKELKSLIELTEKRDLLVSLLSDRSQSTPLEITIGGEHKHPELSGFTLVTSEYRSGELKGVIGVIGPTRMPYEKVVSIVETASLLVSQILTD